MWTLIQCDWCPDKKRKFGHRGKTLGGHSKKAAIGKPRRQASGETTPAHTWISDFQPPGLGEIDVCCFSRPLCGALLWQPELTKPLRNGWGFHLLI